MTFEEILDQAIAMLQRRGRLTYGALKRHFQLDDAYLEDVKVELIEGQRLAVDEDGRVLVWVGEAAVTPAPPAASSPTRQPTTQKVPPPPVAPSPLDAERRQLTIMFCDLVGSTALSAQLDPEDLREVVRAYQTTCAEVIQRFDGHIAQYLGDGLLVYFGYPQAHEDDAQRAVRAGLGIVAAMETRNAHLEQHSQVRLAVRLGIHTGLVVVGEMGGGGRQEQLALGETPNIAARLQGLAAPDTVVISEATAHLIHGYFVCQPLGAQALKGLAQPLMVYRVLHESGAQTRLDVAATRGLTRLVGREQEVGLLADRWQRATESMGQVVVLTGEAGIGKSRLVRVLRDQIGNTVATHIECRCSPHTQHSALYPVIAHLERALAFTRHDTPADKLHKLEDALASYAVPLADLVPLFAALLSLPLPAHSPPLTFTPQRQRQKTLEALLTWLWQETDKHPVLFIVEDLHWVDPSTLEFLSLLVDQSPTARIVVLMTCRPELTPPWPSRAHVIPLTLTRLPRPHVERMVASVVGAKTLPQEVVQQIVAKTDGVPLFVEELTKTVLESGLLREHEDHYELTGPLPALAIPATLQDSLMAWLDRLATVKTVAQLGATIGRQFAYDLLQAISPLDEDTLQQGLRQLVEAELLYQRGMPPQATYRFKHALIQDVAYQSLLRSSRQQYHQHIAQVLEARFPETVETQPEVLAQHFTAAGGHAQALPYWQRAGQRALECSAHREAVGCFEQALGALSRLPETRDTHEQAIDLRLALRSALLPSGDFGRTLEVLREAESLAAALDEPRRLGRVLGYLAIHFNQQGAYDQSFAIAQRVLALATAAGNAVQQALTNDNLGRIHSLQGAYRQAVAYFGQTAAFFDGARRFERFGQFFLPAVRTRAYLAVCHAELGMFTEGRVLGDEGLRIAEAATHPGSLMMAYWGLGVLAFRQGRLPRALPLLARAVGLCQEADLPSSFPLIAPALGVAHALSGRVADAVSLLTQAMEQAIAMARVDYQAFCRLSAGEAQVLAGRLEEAHALAEGALTLTRRHQERGNQAYALCLLGDIGARREPPDSEQAEAHYQQALALAVELGMRPLEAHCHCGLGTLYAATGQREPARAELSAATALYRAMDMTFWLPQAEAALAQVA